LPQSSLNLYKALLEVAAQRCQWQQQWQQLHQQHQQAAAQQVQLWRGRTALWSRQPPQEESGPAQQQQQQQQQDQEKEGVQQAVLRQQQQEQDPEQEQELWQALQQQQAQHQHQQEVQQQPQQPHPQSLEQPKEHQPQQHQQQQQQQLQPLAWPLSPVLWLCRGQLQAAEQWLQEQQRALALSERGVLLWQQLGQQATQQVRCSHREEGFFGGGGEGLVRCALCASEKAGLSMDSQCVFQVAPRHGSMRPA
jgi:hypothetical protein